MSEKLLNRVSTNISNHYKNELMKVVFETHLPMSRLIAIALENELSKEKPFEYDYTIPSDETMEYAYAEQASKILQYLKDLEGIGLDALLLVRHDIGIPDKETFLYAFRECLEAEMIEAFAPRKGPYTHTDYPIGYLHYRLVGKNPKVEKKLKNKAKRFEKLQKLKKEFKDVE